MPCMIQNDPQILAFDRFVRESAHPCVMARAVLTHEAVTFGRYAALGERAAAAAHCRDLYAALDEPRDAASNWSFVALFSARTYRDERSFERALWQHLQRMHEYDAAEHRWDPTVDSDPQSADFSFSIGGRAWYVIGLHPAASRLARRFESVALVFNPHQQFERLRSQGKYAVVRDKIRERDRAVQGSVNPMLADHGDKSEARQYSGRAVANDWRCPFHAARGTGSTRNREQTRAAS
jgi:uncharacterized protein